MHTREPGITYNLFSYPAPSTDSLIPTSALNSGWTTGAPYYALLLLSEAFSNLGTTANGSVVVDLNFADVLSGAGYALYDADNLSGNAPRALVLMNFGNGTAADANSTSSTFTLPASLVSSKSSTTSVRLMTAPTLNEQSASRISYAGQNVDDTGALTGARATTTIDCHKGCEIVVPGPGAALVVLNDKTVKQDTSKPKNGGATSSLASPSMSAWLAFFLVALVVSFA